MRKFRPKQPRLRLSPEAYRELCRQILERDGWRCQSCGTPRKPTGPPNRSICGYLVGGLTEKLTSLKGRRLCVLGLSYKPFTDDVRESPGVDFVRALLAEGAKVQVYDPAGNQEAAKVLKQDDVSFHDTPYAAAAGVDAVAVLTEWNDFRNPDLNYIRRAMNGNLLLDSRNIYDPAVATAHGFQYVGWGRRAPVVRQQ